ncbi:Minor histocompatibility antigen H13 like protein [Argiope bruennichi]|uniref:Minor histocompatibility antigen H13 like protein n=1 Tax=Argiope bruennichi TaxID=94029 RepID=A0A8T0FB14_ARGBR|nr:Minor histocompatibility antigen H13 like protein [Argiope bruennichi]
MTLFGSGREIRELGFMPTFKVQGQVCHRIGSLQPQPNEEPKFLQVYFVADKEQQVEQRCRNVRDLKPGIVSQLQEILHRHNSYVRSFKCAMEKITPEMKIVIHADKVPSGEHERKFNAPTISEVILAGDKHGSRDISLELRSNEIKKIAETHRAYDALQYALIFWQVEWQKRGLPHAHILPWFQKKCFAHKIDDLITAELPNPETNPILYNVVKTQMIHGPCGSIYPLSPCMKDGNCTKMYPRDFLKETQTGHDGYPLYRRWKPEDGGQVTIKKVRGSEVVIENRWIVPFCPLLSRAFNAHINVEYCSSIESIKYVCKYINKGSDMAIFNLTNNDIQYDEIQTHEIERYLSSNEAVWRILGFSIHERHPNVVHLSVHLDNGQRVYFTEENVLERVQDPPETTLTAFFSLCQSDAFALSLLYHQVPKYYTWNKSNKKWVPRKSGQTVPDHPGIKSSDALGHVYTVHPSNSECFHLRLLLHEVIGPTSFSDLKTLNGIVCETFIQACGLRGLLEEDSHWKSTLDEAATTHSGRMLRDLFAVILHTCCVSNLVQLWNLHRENMSEDILHKTRIAVNNMDLDYNDEIFNSALLALEDKIKTLGGTDLKVFGLPEIHRDINNSLNYEIIRETRYNIHQLTSYIETNEPNLIDDQRLAFEKITSAVFTETGGIYFLDAPGGTVTRSVRENMADFINETVQEVARNATEKPKASTEGMLIAYSSLVIMALLPIFFGAFRSVKFLKKQKDSGEKPETMSKKDAAMFPVIASCALLGLYIFFKIFSKEYINLLVTLYFFGLGVLALTHILSPFVSKFVPESYQTQHHLVYTRGLGDEKEELLNFSFVTGDIIALGLCTIVGGIYLWNKHWVVNNIFGLAFALNGVEFLHLNKVIIGCTLLGGLFVYDIFWVFATDVMVTVAKSFEAPIKLVFPQDILENWLSSSNFAMLGLGDVVIPGIFIALLLRFDESVLKMHCQLHQCSCKYQTPALLYLVPACIGVPGLVAVMKGDVKALLAYADHPDDEEEETSKESTPEKSSEESRNSVVQEAKKHK